MEIPVFPNLRHFPLKLSVRGPWLLRFICLGAALLQLGLSKIQAQQATDYAIQANIIYRFTKYIDWPDYKKSGDFMIGVLGASPLTDALTSFIANKTAGNRKIVIKKFSSVAQISYCQILFISEDEGSVLRKIALKTAGSPVLIVTESDGAALKGACINFSIVADHLRLEINKSNIEQRDLSIATELLQLGNIVQ